MKTVDAAAGKWRGILAEWIDPSYLDGKHHACPLCGGKDRFRFLDYKSTGSWVCNNCADKPRSAMDLLIEYTGSDFKTLADEIDQLVGNIKADEPPKEKDYAAILKRTSEGVQRDLRLTPVHKYLRTRGIDITPLNVGYSPSCGYYENGDKPMPAMVARIQKPNMERVSFHLTFLTPDGRKAPLEKPRKMRGPHPAGAGVYLSKPAPEMVVGEGIETTLAGMQIFSLPGIAALSAGGLEKIEFPEQVRSVRILADADRSFTGQKSAYALAQRLAREGKRVAVEMPELGTDFADLVAV